MTIMYVSFYSEQANLSPVPGSFLKSDAVTIDTAAQSIAAPANTKMAIVWADGAFYHEIGTNPTAGKDTDADPKPAGYPWPVAISAGQKIGGIKI